MSFEVEAGKNGKGPQAANVERFCLKTEMAQGNRKVRISYIVWMFSYSGGRSKRPCPKVHFMVKKQRPYEKIMSGRGAACDPNP